MFTKQQQQQQQKIGKASFFLKISRIKIQQTP